MNLKLLTKQLIKIPSYVNDSCDEEKIGDFIYQYLVKNTSLIVKKQKVEGNRNNIIAYSASCVNKDKFSVETMFIDHIDTVEPKTGWKFNQFEGKEVNERIYGLGSCDTKGNVAVLMKLAEKTKKEKIMFLFYCDEEYDFKGIKKFINDYKNKLKVNKIISTDGLGMQIRYACRGLIEIDLEIYGTTGHSANPKNGKNAITLLNNILNMLNLQLKNKYQEGLGYPSLNLSYIRGGLLKDKNKSGVVLGKNGNNIADYVEATVELRINQNSPFSLIKKNLPLLAKQSGVKLVIKNVRHNLPPWITKKNNVRYLLKSLKQNGQMVSYMNAGISGYVDIAMLANTFNAVCCTIGASGANSHAVNEYVEIKSLDTLFRILISAL